MASQPKDAQRSDGMIRRGVKKSDVPATTAFIGFRLLDPLLQYGILAHGVGTSLIEKVGLDVLPAGPPNTGTFLDAFGLSPYRLVLFAMSVGTVAKQSWWISSVAQEHYTIGSGAIVGALNLTSNAINSYAFVTAATSGSLSSGSQFPQTPLLVGSALYTVGLGIEAFSEWDRKKFKEDPANKGKVYTGKLWSIARHINYTGYGLWRIGYGLAAGGWPLGILSAAVWGGWFVFLSIPEITEYLSERYGAQWEAYKEKTPYKLIPYIY